MEKITLRTTEFIDSEKRSPGYEVSLPPGDPILVKTKELEKAARAEARADKAADDTPATPATPKPATDKPA